MKNSDLIIRITCFLLLITFGEVSGQTFQNTFLPTGEDNYVAGVCVNNNYWVAGNTNSFNPSMGTEHILFSKYSGATGASLWDRKYYNGANPAIQFTASDIQAGYSVITPSPGNSVPPLPCTFVTCPVPGTQVNAIKQPDSKDYFYLTGHWVDPALNVRRLLVMRLSTNGNIVWVRTNVIVSGSTYDEAGVSLESCPNGDVIAVSVVSTANGQVFPAATRIDINGNLLWRYHYPQAPGEPNYNFRPRQSCAFSELIPGAANSAIGFAIVGECQDSNVPGTSFFVMRIGYNGGMIWKFNYPLIFPTPGVISNDVGWDIMFEAEGVGNPVLVDNFIVTGITNTMGAGPVPGAKAFVSRVATMNGAFVNLYRYGSPGTTQAPLPITYGQGIYQATSAPQRVVVTGGIDDPNNQIFFDTYLLEMNVTNGTLIWSNRYLLTTPNYPRTESVVSAAGNIPTPGYFISTNSFDTYGGGTATDGHVIKTDVIGKVNATNCPSDTLKLLIDSLLSNPVIRCTEQRCDSIKSRGMKMKKLVTPHVLCWSATKLEELSSSSFEWEGDLSVYPNPVTTDEATLLFTSEKEVWATIEILNLNGEKLYSERRLLSEGDQQIRLNIKDITAGIYLIKLSDGESVYAAKLIRAAR